MATAGSGAAAGGPGETGALAAEEAAEPEKTAGLLCAVRNLRS
jgi:hypothetical protein